MFSPRYREIMYLSEVFMEKTINMVNLITRMVIMETECRQCGE